MAELSSAGSTIVRNAAPPADLRPLVEAFAQRRVAAQVMLLPVFATARVEMLFHFGDPFLVACSRDGPFDALPPAVVLRARAAPSWQKAGPSIDWFLVKLTPLGCRALLGIPQAELWDEDVPLDTIWGAFAGRVWERLAETPAFEDRVVLFTGLLRDLVRPVGATGEVYAAAADRRTLARAASPAEIAARLDVGDRRLRQGFRAEVGRAPKTLLRIARFGHYLAGLHPLGGAQAEPCAGDYFDDSHAIREFRAFSGMTPGAYRRAKADGDRLVFAGPPEPAEH